MNTHIASARKSVGISLIEILVVLGILAILSALAAPTIQDSMYRYQSATINDELRNSIAFARSEAIRTRSPVVIRKTVGANCANQEWQCGWFTFVDLNNDGVQQLPAEPTVRTVDAQSSNTIINMFSGNVARISFDRWGNITPLGAFRMNIVPGANINNEGVRTMCISSGGRIRTVDGDATNVACAAALGQ